MIFRDKLACVSSEHVFIVIWSQSATSLSNLICLLTCLRKKLNFSCTTQLFWPELGDRSKDSRAGANEKIVREHRTQKSLLGCSQ